MKKVLMTLCGVAMLGIASLAQQTDTTRIRNNSEGTETGTQDQNSDRATQGKTETEDQSTAPARRRDQSTTQDQPVDNGQTENTATPQDQSTQSGQTKESGKDRKKSKKNTP